MIKTDGNALRNFEGETILKTAIKIIKINTIWLYKAHKVEL